MIQLKNASKGRIIVLTVSVAAAVIVAAVLIPVLQWMNVRRQPLLTQGMDQVSVISTKVMFQNGSIGTGTFTAKQAKEEIGWICKSIKGTKIKACKITDEEKKKVGYPLFVLAVTYRNGKRDIICSDRTGHFIYRVLGIDAQTLLQPTDFNMLDGIAASHYCVGGDNQELVAVVTQGAVK